MMPVILPPTMYQPPGTLLQPVKGVVVGGTMIGGAPPTRGDGKTTKDQRGKDKVEIAHCCHFKYYKQHGKSLEEASKCSGKGVRSMCTGGQGGLSLECRLCNSITKCKCPMPKTKG